MPELNNNCNYIKRTGTINSEELHKADKECLVKLWQVVIRNMRNKIAVKSANEKDVNKIVMKCCLKSEPNEDKYGMKKEVLKHLLSN